jgi:mannose-6-phosphate isomerase-like protein (cupin superfamily)
MCTRVLLPCLVAVILTSDAFAQDPAPPAQPPAQTPAQPPATPPATPPKKPATRRQQPAQSMVPTTVTVTITDASGAPVDNVHVSATGPVSRQTLSIDTGVARLNSVKPGDYRLRFERDGFLTLERDLTVKGGSPASIDVSLTPAPPAPASAAPEPPPSAATNAPPGEAQSVSIVDFLEKNHFSGKEPQRVDQLGCTASAKTTLLQVKDDQPETAQKDADEVIYVVGGDGKMRLGNTDIALTAGSLAIVPRGTVRALSRKGRSPLIVLSILSGPPCTK